jgi:hypothetical protein
MKVSFLLIGLILTGTVLAQSEQNFREGYIILNNGDTLTGLVMDRDESAFGGLLNKVKFRPDKGWRKKYKPAHIKGYRRGNDIFKSIWLDTETRMIKNYYYSQPGKGERVFVKLAYAGSFELYHWEYTDEDNSAIEYIPLIKRYDTNEMVRVTQGIFGLKRKRLANYFNDCPNLSIALIEKQLSSVDELIRFYEDQCR